MLIHASQADGGDGMESNYELWRQRREVNGPVYYILNVNSDPRSEKVLSEFQ
jgi:hypothetical protein